ncbi:MAG: hypothetical protein ACREFC_10620, partial [Stellaceae bacterium]
MTTRLGVLGMLAALAAGVLAVGPGAAFAQDQKPLRVAMNADQDVLDMTQSTNPPQGLATLSNVYEGLWGFNPDGTKRAGLMVATDVQDGGKTIVL